MRLPEKEIKFFEWLAINDENVWKDLWDDADAEPYVVGISFLPMLLAKNGRGFPICDLLNCENFYFSEQHLVDEESRIIIDTARNLFTEHKKLTPAQLLALEISFDPIDIWHFAYKYNMNLTEAKNAVKVLVQDKALVHLTDAAHLAALINF
ncbi:MAG: hypothetical protein QG635_2439 [Bacteroidota bacterium]|nr:hypothetical protein [Bacteroidota bacterium]